LYRRPLSYALLDDIILTVFVREIYKRVGELRKALREPERDLSKVQKRWT
jgi:hypothetical protein